MSLSCFSTAQTFDVSECDSLEKELHHLQDEADGKATLNNYQDFQNLINQTKQVYCPKIQSSLYRNLGIEEMNLNQLNSAEISFRKSIKLAQSLTRRDYLGSSYNMLGALFHTLDQLDSATQYYELALVEMHHDSAYYLDAQLFQNLSHVYLAQHQLKKADQYAKLLSEYGAINGDDYALCNAQQLSILIDMDEQGVSSKTFSKLFQCLACFNALDDQASILNIYENIGLAHEKNMQFDSAALYYELATNYADSLNSIYDLSYLNKSTSNLSKIIQTKNRWQQNWIYTLIILILTLIVITFILLRLRWQKMVIQKQKIDRLMQTQEIQAMDAMLSGQDRERKRIAEELHDRLGGMLGAIKMHYNTVEDQISDLQIKVKSEYKRTGSLIDETAEEVRRISHDLYSGVLVKFGLKAALTQLQDAFTSVKTPIFNWHVDQINRRFESDIEINIYRIIQEGISNILKHANANELTIQITDHQDELSVIIEDDGKGFDVNTVKEGIGLDNIKSRVSRINGQLSIDSHPSSGTTISIQIPLSS